MPDARESRIAVPLRWGDLDVLGHVSQSRYHELLEEARAAIFAPLHPAPVGYPFVLAHIELSHRRELHRADGRVVVRSVVELLGRSRVVLGHRVELEDGALLATARSVLVAFDEAARATRPLADAERAALEALATDGAGPAPGRVRLTAPGAFPTLVTLRWRDMNPMGHLDQARFHELLDEGRAAAFAPFTGERGFPLVLARVEADYLHEVRRADGRIDVLTGVEELGERKVVLGHRFRRPDGTLVAVGRSVMVAFDLAERRSRALSEQERAFLGAC